MSSLSPRRAWSGRRPHVVRRSLSLEQRKHCTLRIGHDSETADAWNVVRRPVHLSTLFPDFSGSAINIVDGHITNPSRPSACVPNLFVQGHEARSEEHTSELQSLMRTSYAVFCVKKKKKTHKIQN